MPVKGETKRKDDGSKLPKRPPSSLSTDRERKAYRRIEALLTKTAFASGADLEAVVLAAQRLGFLEELRAVRAALPRGEWYRTGGNGQLVPHPVFNQLARAERDVSSSLRSLLMTTSGRSSTRLAHSELDQALPTEGLTADEIAAQEDLR